MSFKKVSNMLTIVASPKQLQDKIKLKNQNIFEVKNEKNRKNKTSVRHDDVNTA
jgi:hypothetical protein